MTVCGKLHRWLAIEAELLTVERRVEDTLSTSFRPLSTSFRPAGTSNLWFPNGMSGTKAGCASSIGQLEVGDEGARGSISVPRVPSAFTCVSCWSRVQRRAPRAFNACVSTWIPVPPKMQGLISVPRQTNSSCVLHLAQGTDMPCTLAVPVFAIPATGTGSNIHHDANVDGRRVKRAQIWSLARIIHYTPPRLRFMALDVLPRRDFGLCHVTFLPQLTKLARSEYAILAACIAISNLHKETKKSFSTVIGDLYNFALVNPKTGQPASLISKETYDVVMANAATLDTAIVYNRDFTYNYFGFKTLERSYLVRIDGGLNTSSCASPLGYTAPTSTASSRPTISCLSVTSPRHSDSLQRQDTAAAAQLVLPPLHGGGLYRGHLRHAEELCDDQQERWRDWLTSIRATGSYTASTNSCSNDTSTRAATHAPRARSFLVPPLTPRRHVRAASRPFIPRPPPLLFASPGSGAVPLLLGVVVMVKDELVEVAVVRLRGAVRVLRFFFVESLAPAAVAERAAMSLSFAAFAACRASSTSKRARSTSTSSFVTTDWEKRKEGRKKASLELWHTNVNAHDGNAPTKNLGTIKSPNLCTKIIEYSAPDETVVCNLASIAIPRFILNSKYGFQHLHDITKVVAFNLNRIIDVNYCPIPETRRSNMHHLAIGFGVQGLADVFLALRLPFESAAAKQLNQRIFETIYHGVLEASAELAEMPIDCPRSHPQHHRVLVLTPPCPLPPVLRASRCPLHPPGLARVERRNQAGVPLPSPCASSPFSSCFSPRSSTRQT
ncbi:ribonucleotide reductase [Mycena filopes]|nr:ribonucleotide reductase [Mycena filopes]